MGGGNDFVSDNIVYRMAMDDPVPWYRKRNLRYLYLLLFPTVIGIEMTSGFDSQIINAVQIVPGWKTYFGNPQSGYKGILAASLPLGSCIGLPFIPWVNDLWGRRWCIMLGSLLMIFGSLLQGFSQNGAMYIVSRCIIGFGLPYTIVAGSCLIGELGYPKERPALTSLFNACYFIGAIVAASIAFGTQQMDGGNSEWSWRIPSLLQMSPSLLQVAFVFFLPESPRFLISRDRHEEAYQILVMYHGEGKDTEFVKAEMAEVKATLAIEMEHSKQSWADVFRTAGMRRRLLIGSLLGMFTQLSGNTLLSYYLTDLLNLLGFKDPNFQAQYNIGGNCWGFVCSIVASYFVLKLRRRTMYIMAILTILAIYVSWTICTERFQSTGDETAAKLSLFWIYAYSIGYNVGFNALTYTYLVEIFPYSARARGITVFQLFGKLSQFFSTNVNPVGLSAIQWKYLLVYCIWIVFEAICIFFLWPETSGRTLEELAFLFEPEELAAQRTMAVEKTIHHEDNPETVHTAPQADKDYV